MLAQAGGSVARFLDSGIAALGDKLGPVVWQFAPAKRFEAEDFEAFLNLLPAQVEGVRLRHVLEVRHESFASPDYLALARRYRMATVFADSPRFPSLADLSADFVYARLMGCSEKLNGYAPKARTPARARHGVVRRRRTGRPAARRRGTGAAPAARGLRLLHQRRQGRAPAAAQALLDRLGWRGPAGRRPEGRG